MILRTRTWLYAASSAVMVCAVIACGSDSTGTTAPVQTPPGTGGRSSLPPSAGSAAAGTTARPTGAAGSASVPSTPVAGSASAAGSAATAGSTSTPTGPGNEGAQVLPCNVSKALRANCQSCHGASTIGGAPMSLVTYADLHKPAVSNSAMRVYQISKARLNDKARPMPPGGEIAAADLAVLDAWFGAGAPAGTAADATCDTTPTTSNSTMEAIKATNQYGALTPLPGETCYDFPVHGGQTLPDDTAYDVGFGEHYEQFYYRAPWPAGTVATRYGAKLDNQKVLHHWLLFSTIEFDAEGTHKTSPLPTLNGVNAQLLAGWAVGGTNLAMPDDVGFELPGPGTTLNIQWHFYNNTATPQADKSVVQICTVPAVMREHSASITWTGTEDLNGNVWFGGAGMPPHQMSTFQGTCDPLRAGMGPNEPIHIIGFWPHMHQLGTRMQATVNHANGTKELIFDKPFDFNHQIHYIQSYDLMPGDTITTTCTFNNTTNKGIPFGESSDTEMCYLFTMSYPAHALENNVISLIGATNTCW